MKNSKMICHSFAWVTLLNDSSHALNRLAEDAMSINANVYPTGIEAPMADIVTRATTSLINGNEMMPSMISQMQSTPAYNESHQLSPHAQARFSNLAAQLQHPPREGYVLLIPAPTRANNMLLALLLSLAFLLTVASLPILLLTAVVPVFLLGAVRFLRSWMILNC